MTFLSIQEQDVKEKGALRGVEGGKKGKQNC